MWAYLKRIWKKPIAVHFPARLTLNEFLTLLVGIGTLVVSFLTYQNAADTKAINAAVGNLSDLAVQTKRQADGQAGQLQYLKAQNETLSGQLEEAKKQTAAISSQTDAIKENSDANVRAAHAQQRMAEVTTEAQKPNVDLNELFLSGLTNALDKDGRVPTTLMWRFRNSGGSALTVKEVYYGMWFGDSLPDAMPKGFVFKGLDTVVLNSITSIFSPSEPIAFSLDKTLVDSVNSGKEKVFFFAVFKYVDGLNVPHSKCFGRQFDFKDGATRLTVPSGGAAYHCST